MYIRVYIQDRRNNGPSFEICEKVDVEMEFAVPCSPTNEVFMLTLKDLSLSTVCFPANI